ncbi:MAG: hypothetical protein IJ001_06250 [Oscillospiraceae bacterium]|nr:hypothetical protein [Oscillospiraceae bacterium]
MCEEKKLIVSLTSYPARINTVGTVVENLYTQTRLPDAVVLWLAEEQFPNREEDLPNYLRNLMDQGKVTVRWCDDLKSHKKYFYALQEYSNDLVVTVDDDLLYPEHMLENLYQCYLRHPNAVSTVRAHLMIFTEAGKLMPYRDWIQETDVCLDEPSMQLFATGGAGTLYPGGIFKKELFDKEAIKETCLMADDLWLKAMALLSDVPVVVAQEFEDLRYIPGSQVEALYHQNVDSFANETQWEQISGWVDAHFEPGLLDKKLTQSDIGTRIMGIEAMCMHLRRERQKKKAQTRELNEKLKRTYAEKSELSAKLKKTYAEKSAKTREILALQDELEQTIAKTPVGFAKKVAKKILGKK